MRRLAALVLVTTSLLLIARPVGAASMLHVGVVDFDFKPRNSTGVVGSTVSWEWADNIGAAHNVQEDHKLFKSGPPTSDPTTVFTRAPSAGTFHYFCTLHGAPGGGMDGSIAIAPGTAAGPAGSPFDVTWASSATKTGTVFDVQYRIGTRRWKDWRIDAAAFSGTFGASGMPVAVRSGTTYGFRARSQFDATSPTRVSGWSPTASYMAP